MIHESTKSEVIIIIFFVLIISAKCVNDNMQAVILFFRHSRLLQEDT